jgi:hypothetical protein
MEIIMEAAILSQVEFLNIGEPALPSVAPSQLRALDETEAQGIGGGDVVVSIY